MRMLVSLLTLHATVEKETFTYLLVAQFCFNYGDKFIRASLQGRNTKLAVVLIQKNTPLPPGKLLLLCFIQL